MGLCIIIMIYGLGPAGLLSLVSYMAMGLYGYVVMYVHIYAPKQTRKWRIRIEALNVHVRRYP